MIREERFDSLQMAMRAVVDGSRAEIWTTLPCLVENYDPTENTVSCLPLIQARVLQQDGSYQWVTLPLLVDVPVVFPSGGGYTLTFPIMAGDEILVVFSSRNIDGWWGTGQVGVQPILRMHDLSDGFAIPGVKSLPKVIPSISTTAVQLRSNDGSTYIELGSAEVKIVATTVTVNSTNATVNASTAATVVSPSIILKNAGTALKTLLNSTLLTWLNSHVHGNGNGGANTTAPTTTPSPSVSTSVVQAE